MPPEEHQCTLRLSHLNTTNTTSQSNMSARVLIVAGSYSGVLYGLELHENPLYVPPQEPAGDAAAQPPTATATVTATAASALPLRLQQAFAASAHLGCIKCVEARGATLVSGATDENLQFRVVLSAGGGGCACECARSTHPFALAPTVVSHQGIQRAQTRGCRHAVAPPR